MSYHSKDGREFLGMRTPRKGLRQVVYDATTGERVVVIIRDATISAKMIDAALREGIGSNKVLPGVFKALEDRNISFEVSS